MFLTKLEDDNKSVTGFFFSFGLGSKNYYIIHKKKVKRKKTNFVFLCKKENEKETTAQKNIFKRLCTHTHTHRVYKTSESFSWLTWKAEWVAWRDNSSYPQNSVKNQWVVYVVCKNARHDIILLDALLLQVTADALGEPDDIIECQVLICKPINLEKRKVRTSSVNKREMPFQLYLHQTYSRVEFQNVFILHEKRPKFTNQSHFVAKSCCSLENIIRYGRTIWKLHRRSFAP